jgi:hypothetical protein
MSNRLSRTSGLRSAVALSPPPAAAELRQDAIKQSLRWAQESADRGDYPEAVGWIQTLELIGEKVPPSYEAKRREWDAAQIVRRSGQEQP